MGRPRKHPAADVASGGKVRVRLFGLVELDNRWGHAAENITSPSYSWLLMKYLLVNPGREVPLGELLENIWTNNEEINIQYAANIRLRRLREALAPLFLDGPKGLIFYHDGLYSLNPNIELETDEKIFWRLMKRIRSAPMDEPGGLALCAQALELYRGRFMEHTKQAPWLASFRTFYDQEFCDLARETLGRMKALDDDRHVGLLGLRAATVIPEEEELHRELTQYMNERGREIELMRYRVQLARYGEGDRRGELVGSV